MIEHIKEGYVKVEREHGIATIEFFHPQSNSLPGKILDALAKEIYSEGLNKETKVIVLRSAGEKVFCSGASFDELSAIKTEEEGLAFFSGFAKVINAMRTCGKIIIARIQGRCIGGGVGLAAAADYAIACEGADVKLSEVAVGIGPFVVGPAVERKIGLSAMSELAINATEWRSADWAKKKGLYTDVFETEAEMDAEIKRLAERLASSNQEAMSMLKGVFWQGTEHWDELLVERAGMSGKLVLSDFTVNAINAFKKN